MKCNLSQMKCGIWCWRWIGEKISDEPGQGKQEPPPPLHFDFTSLMRFVLVVGFWGGWVRQVALALALALALYGVVFWL